MPNPYEPPSASNDIQPVKHALLRGCLVDILQLVIVGVGGCVGFWGPMFVFEQKKLSGGNPTVGGADYAIAMVTGPLGIIVSLYLAWLLYNRK